MTKKLKVFFLAALLFFGFAQASYAQLAAVGPVDPGNGFPSSYTDGNGNALAPCLTVFDALAVNAGCPPFDPEPGLFDPANPIAFPGNFPSEFFYFDAEPDFTLVDPGGVVQQIRFALMGAFGGGPPLANDQIVFQVKRFRVTVPLLGDTITIDHPFGTDTLTDGVAPDDLVADGEINVTLTEPVNPVPLDFNTVLGSSLIGPFLLATPLPAALPGFIGDMANPQFVTGSPIRNNISISGDVNLTTDQWFLGGRFAAAAGPAVTVDKATFSRGSVAILGGHVDVVATSASPAATLTVSGGPNLPLAPVNMVGDGLGVFSATVPLSNASVLPAQVTVTATMAGPPPLVTTVNAPLVDMVNVTKAQYNAFTRDLTVEAVSSDKQGAPVLTAVGFGALVGGSLVSPLVTSAPAQVQVTSSAGGSATVPVDIMTMTLRVVTYSTSTDTYNLRGNSVMPAGTPVNAFLTRTGALIGSRNVKANNGKWVIQIAGRGVIAQPGDTVTFESAGDQLIFPLVIVP